MKLNEAIDVLKERSAWIKLHFKESTHAEAIDTVVAELEKPLPTDEQIEQYALENILDGVVIQSMINTKAWIAGATWMRGLIQERIAK